MLRFSRNMYTILVFGINALLIEAVQARPETNVNFMHNGRFGSRTIEAKEPGGIFGEQEGNGYGNNGYGNNGYGNNGYGNNGYGNNGYGNDGYRGGNFEDNEERNDGADWSHKGKGGWFGHRKHSDDEQERDFKEGEDDQEMQDWAGGSNKKHDWRFWRHKKGKNGGQDGEGGEREEDGEEGKKEPGGKHENFVEKKWNDFVGDKVQDALSSAGIKGPAQEVVIRGAIQQGVLEEEQAPEGMARPKGIIDTLFYPMYKILSFSHVGPLAQQMTMQKG